MTTSTDMMNHTPPVKPASAQGSIYKPKSARSRRTKTTTSSSSVADSTMKETSSVKRTRASVPRPRSGCQTCKRRHVKCDETKPECTKCINTGRKCDGYTTSTTKGASRLSALASTLSIASYEIPFKIPGSQNDRRIFHYYCVHAASDLAVGSLPSFWNTLVLQCSQDEPVVRSALLALSYEHLDYVTRDPEDRRFDFGQESASLEGLQQHHKALRQLRKYIGTNRRPSVKAVLVCCLLFHYFECSRGDYQTGLLHLRNGLAILRSEQIALQSFQDPASADADADLAQLVAAFSIVDAQVSLLDFGRLPELDLATPAEKTGQSNCLSLTGNTLETFDPTERARIKMMNWAARFMIINQQFKYSDIKNVHPSVLGEKAELERQTKLYIDTVELLEAKEKAKNTNEESTETARLASDLKARCIFILMSVQNSIATGDTPFRVPNATFNTAVELLTNTVHKCTASSRPRGASIVSSRRNSGEQGDVSEQEDSPKGKHLQPPASILPSRSASPSPLPESMARYRTFSTHSGILAACLVLAAKTTSREARDYLINLVSQCMERREGPWNGAVVNEVLRSLENMEEQYHRTHRAGRNGAQGEEDGSSSEGDDSSDNSSSDSDSDSVDTTRRYTREYADQLLDGRPFCVIAACLKGGNHGNRCCWCDDTRSMALPTEAPSLEDIGARMVGGVNGFERLLQSRLRKRSG